MCVWTMVDYDEELSEIILYKCLEIGLGVLVWKYFNPVGNILTPRWKLTKK